MTEPFQAMPKIPARKWMSQLFPFRFDYSPYECIHSVMQPRITQFGTLMQWQDQWNVDMLCQLIENFILETDQVSPNPLE
jgi:hypothetical protein